MSKHFYIFLDIDGVMNSENYFWECFHRHNVRGIMSLNCYPFDPKCLNNLMILRQKLNNNEYKVHIILSSTWRMNNVDTAIVNSRLAEYGMRITDKTIILDETRTEEIKEYINRHNCTNYLVLDDENCDIPNDHFIHTNFKTGFDDKKLQEALEKVGIK